MAEFAHVIIDISHEKVDRPFTYRIPEPLREQVHAGCLVDVPFGKGNRVRSGYVVDLSDQAGYDPSKIKEIAGIHAGSVSAESQLIQVAWWMKERYGSTMNQALKTVLPVKQQIRQVSRRFLRCLLSPEDLEEEIQKAVKKGYKARERLLRAMVHTPVLPYEMAVSQLNLSPASIRPLTERGVIAIDTQLTYRNPADGFLAGKKGKGPSIRLNDQQQAAVSQICSEYDAGIRKTYLIHGITGSGKTEIYMELIDHVRSLGKQVILLIPEISLTYQTVMRFCRRFGGQVSFINSRLSAGEKYDQFERARKGEIQIMIGPRSALFTPFKQLGLIIIDEEHEGAYKSELTPRYHARETAQYRAALSQASVVLGSATPSVESYSRAVSGLYGYFRITRRAKANSVLPQIQVVDMRRELKEGNRSVFSRILQQRIQETLKRQEQVMLFLNRRGYSQFLSCRSCGEAIKCPHCDVTLTLHQNQRLVCHYCGYQIPRPGACPVCQSPYLAPFGTGTEKIEAMVRETFPSARVLRMDLDTTSKKGSHDGILAAFGAHEADILIGTQMIVKGHDFPAVTLVGILAADLSLYAPDYRCGERTFQLLTQAAGRAGRDARAGEVMIQTYSPDHYCIQAAAAQDYDGFYEKEMAYRRLLGYPPASALMTLTVSSQEEAMAEKAMGVIHRWMKDATARESASSLQLIGPVNAPIYKLNDIYRKILYMKCKNCAIISGEDCGEMSPYRILIQVRKWLEERWKTVGADGTVALLFDFP